MKSLRHLRRTAAAVLAAALLPAVAMAGQTTAGQVSQQSGEGLHVARFESPQGAISVYLPDDIRAGDTISGTVSVEPAGQTDKEREQNSGRLSGVVVDVADHPVDPKSPWWVRAIPDAPGPIVVRFRDPRGRPIGETKFPPVSAPAAPPPSDSFEIPTFGQGGHPVAVSGPFTGDPSATAVTVDGRDTPFLAQSPRQTLVRLPADVEGPVELRVAEGDTVATAPFRVVGVRLSADKLDLKRGERTALHVEVRGLDGLDEPVPLTVTNSSPSVIQLEGGESERVTIHPGRGGARR